MKAARIVVATSIALVLAGCGGGSDDEEAQQPVAPPPLETTEETTTAPILPRVEEPAPTARRLVGTWARIGVSLLFRFGPDGTIAFDRVNLDAPYARGTYELDGNKVRLDTNGPSCFDDWTWTAGIVKEKDPLDDELHVVFMHAGCGVPAGVEWMLARVS